MRLNTDRLKNAGIDYEHGFRHYAGCAYHFNNALVFAVRNPVFGRIVRPYTQENVGDLFVCANELKKIADNLGMADVYEAASVLVALLCDGDYDAAALNIALTGLKMAIAIALSGIREAGA